jgi:hypothetical protein
VSGARHISFDAVRSVPECVPVRKSDLLSFKVLEANTDAFEDMRKNAPHSTRTVFQFN